MATLSLFQGYYVLNVFKSYGQTKAHLNDDHFLTMVGSVSAILGTLRFAWSAAMEHPKLTFKHIYGALLVIQIALGATIKHVADSPTLYTVWVCAMMFTEGGHFTLMPNIVKRLYEEQAMKAYGLFFTWVGGVSLAQICLLNTTFGQDYESVFSLTAGLSLLSLILLVTCFREENKSDVAEVVEVQDDAF
jgi:uncharacterized membrane protein YhfC